MHHPPAGPPARRVPAHELHRLSEADALSLVDELLGRHDVQLSAVMEYRLQAEWQADWKAEVGHWLETARRLGFLEELVKRCMSRLFGNTRIAVAIEPNDERHRMLSSDLAPAMLVHYLTGTGWGFDVWEPAFPGFDVDVAVTAPSGERVLVQMKAPDRPGSRANLRVVDGESDAAVVAAILKAANQLPTSGIEPNLIAVSPQRVWPFTSQPHAVVSKLFGNSVGFGDLVILRRRQLGLFSKPEWAHVSGVVLLDLVRPPPPQGPIYSCIVLLNPWARHLADPEWFPRARVCSIEADVVRWRGEAPIHAMLPAGTRIVDADPW